MTKIIRNAAKCLGCGDVIESKHVHNFVTCSCGKLSVDGGREYLRRCFAEYDGYEDISIVEEENEEVEDMNKLRRKQIADIVSKLTSLSESISELMEEEEDCMDNLPDNMQGSSLTDRYESAIDSMDGAVDSISNAIDYLNEAMSA